MKKERVHFLFIIGVSLILLSLLLLPQVAQKFNITGNVIGGASVSNIPVSIENKDSCVIGIKYVPNKFSYTSSCSDESCSSHNIDCTLEINNLDSVGGVFTIVFYLTDSNDNILFSSDQSSSFIASNDYYEFKNTFSGSESNRCTYRIVSSPEKRIC